MTHNDLFCRSDVVKTPKNNVILAPCINNIPYGGGQSMPCFYMDYHLMERLIIQS